MFTLIFIILILCLHKRKKPFQPLVLSSHLQIKEDITV